MAMVVYMCGEEKSRKSSFRADRKPWMLKEYLGDDMSSCSSNGFRSFPRRQCCVAVRNLIEKEVMGSRRNHSKTTKRMITRNDRSISSTLQKASMAVINAVKFLPFNNPAKNSLKSSDGKSFLSRSFSKKLFRRSFFWKKEKTTTRSVMVVKKRKNGDDDDDEIERWISSGVVGTEKYQPLDLSNDTTTVTNVSTTSVSNYSDGKSESSWCDDVTFTSDSSENDVVERREKMEVEGEKEVSKRVGGITGQDSVEPAVLVKETKWLNVEAEKEQSSPISVLDFPYNDESGSSPFTIRASRLEGTKERLMKKLGRFECLASLEAVSFETLMSSTFIEDQSSKCSIQPCSTPSYVLSSESEEEEEDEDEEESHENEVEKQAQDLLNITKAKIPTKITHKIEFENLLLDFFRENVTKKTHVTLLNATEDWLNGHYDKLILGWEVKDKRQAYIKDMEEEGWWPKDTNLQRDEVTSKIGEEVLANLIEEIIVEFCSSIAVVLPFLYPDHSFDMYEFPQIRC